MATATQTTITMTRTVYDTQYDFGPRTLKITVDQEDARVIADGLVILSRQFGVQPRN